VKDHYVLLGGGKTPPEESEVYQNELEGLDDDLLETKHNQLLTDKSGQTDPLFYIRKVNAYTTT
jgi:hypothetical protein